MTERAAEQSPRIKARIAGIFYLLTILISIVALVTRGPLRTATLLVSTGCYVAVTVLFYGLFRPVSRNISILAALSPNRILDSSVDILAQNPRRVDGVRRPWLVDLYFARPLQLSIAIQHGARRSRRIRAYTLAARGRGKCTTLEQAGEGSRLTAQ